MKTLLLSIFTFLLIGFSIGQSLEIVGYARDGSKGVSGTRVILEKDGNEVEAKTTSANGRFLFYTDYSGDYTIKFEKNGYVFLTAEVSSTLPEGAEPEDLTMDFYINMIAQPKSGKVYSFNKAVAKINFQEDIYGFDTDLDYEDMIADELKELEQQIR